AGPLGRAGGARARRDPAGFVEQPGILPAETAPQVVLALAYSPDGRLLATGGEDHVIRFYDLTSKAPPVTLQGHEDAVTSLAFSPDGRTLASAGYDRFIKTSH